MADEIVVKYTADVSQYKAQLKELESAILTTENKSLQANAKTTQAFIDAAAKRADAIVKEKANYARLQQDLKKAFDPETINAFNRLLVESKRNIELLGGSVRSVSNNTKEFLRSVKEGQDKLKQSSATVQSSLNSVRTSAIQLGAIFGIAFGVSQLVSFGKEAFKVAVQLEGIKRRFDQLDNPALLDDLRKATRGTVSDLELMRNAVVANNFQIPLERLGGLFKFASIRARETGQSVDYLVQSIVTGIARKSPLILDNLGINIKRINEEFKRTGDFATAAFNIVNEEMEKSNVNLDSNADKVSRANAQWENFKATIGEGLVESFGFLADQYDDNLNAIKDLTVSYIGFNEEQAKLLVSLGFIRGEFGSTSVEVQKAGHEVLEYNAGIQNADILLKKYNNTTEANIKLLSFLREQYALLNLGTEIGLVKANILAEKLKQIITQNAKSSGGGSNVKTLESLKQELDLLTDLQAKQEIGSAKFIETSKRIKEIQDEIDKALGKSTDKTLKESQSKHKQHVDYLEGIYRQLAEVQISLIQDGQEREIAEINNTLAERLKKIKGNTDAENELRRNLKLKAEQDILQVEFDFKKKQLEELKQLELLHAEDLGKETFEIRKKYIVEQRDLELQDASLTGEQRKLILANADKELGEISIQQLHKEAEQYRLLTEKEKKDEERFAEEKRIIREQTQQALFDLANIGLQLASELNQANLEDEMNALDTRQRTELKNLEGQLSQKLISEEQYQALKAAAENKYEIQRKNAQRDAARREKALRLFSIATQTAENIVKALGVPPVPNVLLASIAAAAGLAQGIAVSAKPLPFAKGTKRVPGFDTGVDSVPAILRPGEKVFTVDTSSAYAPALDAIFDHKVSPRLINAFAEHASGEKKGFAENVANSLLLQQMGAGMNYGKMSKSVKAGTSEMTGVLYGIYDKLPDRNKFDHLKQMGLL
jgi:hypothetical protein